MCDDGIPRPKPLHNSIVEALLNVRKKCSFLAFHDGSFNMFSKVNKSL